MQCQSGQSGLRGREVAIFALLTGGGIVADKAYMVQIIIYAVYQPLFITSLRYVYYVLHIDRYVNDKCNDLNPSCADNLPPPPSRSMYISYHYLIIS